MLSAHAKRELRAALDTLARIPLVGQTVTRAVEPAVGRRAVSHLLGVQRTWIYRALESIGKENVLHTLLLRLMQGRVPSYAQIRQGAIEYGKDLAVVVDVDGKPVLELYQAKVGDLTKKNWPKAKEELEEIFLVPLPELQMPVKPCRVEATLVFNGHVNPYAEPVVDAWLKEQNANGRPMRLMNIDSLVTWIFDASLTADFRAAAAELGLSVK